MIVKYLKVNTAKSVSINFSPNFPFQVITPILQSPLRSGCRVTITSELRALYIV